MSKNDFISRMTDEVIRDIQEKKVGFHKAFAWAAHRRGIYWHESRHLYNDCFRKVRKCCSRRQRTALKKSLQGPRSWQHGKIIRDHPPKKGRWYKKDPWGGDEAKNFIYPDNEGFQHDPMSEFLPPAPS